MSLDLVPVQDNLARDIRRQEIIKTINERIHSLNLNLSNYKNNTELVLLVLNMVEHLVPKSKDKAHKMDKKQLAVDVLSTLLNLNAGEVVALGNSIEFLHSNRMIKKVSKFWIFCCGVREYFTKKK